MMDILATTCGIKSCISSFCNKTPQMREIRIAKMPTGDILDSWLFFSYFPILNFFLLAYSFDL